MNEGFSPVQVPVNACEAVQDATAEKITHGYHYAARAYGQASTLPPAYCASASVSTAQPGSSHVYGLAGNSGGAANPGPAAFGGV